MGNHTQAGRDLSALLCALSFATGLGFGGHMEHGLGSASLGLQIADALALASDERVGRAFSWSNRQTPGLPCAVWAGGQGNDAQPL